MIGDLMKIEKNMMDKNNESREIEYSVQCLLPRLNQPCKGSLVNMQLKQVALGITQRLCKRGRLLYAQQFWIANKRPSLHIL